MQSHPAQQHSFIAIKQQQSADSEEDSPVPSLEIAVIDTSFVDSKTSSQITLPATQDWVQIDSKAIPATALANRFLNEDN